VSFQSNNVEQEQLNQLLEVLYRILRTLEGIAGNMPSPNYAKFPVVRKSKK